MIDHRSMVPEPASAPPVVVDFQEAAVDIDQEEFGEVTECPERQCFYSASGPRYYRVTFLSWLTVGQI